jgi:alkylation response protein AidB-like acyl-CoA dehydrogenase
MTVAADLGDELAAVFDGVLSGTLPQAALLEAAREDRHPTTAYHQAMADVGFFGLRLGTEDGGLDAGGGTLVSLFEVAGARLLPSASHEEALGLAPLLAAAARHGDHDAASWLAQLQAGHLRGGGRTFTPRLDMSASLRTASGDGALVSLDGVWAWLGPDARLAHVATPSWAVVVDLDDAGVRVERHAGAVDPGQGLCRLHARDIAVPSSRLVVGAGASRLVLDWQLAAFAEILGCGAHLLAATVSYAVERRQFGQRIASFQAIAHRLADMTVSVEAVRSALARLVTIAESGPAAAEPLAASLRYWVPSAIRTVCEGAIQVHGGLGFTWEAGLHLHYRRVLQLQAAMGGAFTAATEVGRMYLDRAAEASHV